MQTFPALISLSSTNLSHQELATLLAIPRQTVISWRNGTRQPKAIVREAVLAKLAEWQAKK